MPPLYVHAVGHFHPDNVISNRFLEDLDIGTSDEWILERVGIRERRTVMPLDYIRKTRNVDVRAGQEAALFSNAETGKRAAMMALERAGLRAKDIGMVVAGGCSAEMAIPAEACRIAGALDIDAAALDMNSACSSFGAQLHLLSSMRGLPAYVLVVNAESVTRAVSYQDRATAVLWGDGSSATIVSTEVPARVRLVGSTFGSSPGAWSRVTIPRFGHFAQDGSAVQKFAIKSMRASAEAMLPAARTRIAETGGALHFVGHQANRLVLDTVTRHAGIGENEHWHNVADYGNTGASGAPGVLSQRWDDLSRGDAVIVAMAGSGLSWSSLYLEVEC